MLTIGSLFTGIGGGDLGLERAGMKVLWQVEKDKFCLELLNRYWPKVKKEKDVTKLEKEEIPSVNLIIGGDPCPCRSIAKGNRQSKHPDLSGYFLALVGRLRPQWVVRENVFASDVKNFVTVLECLGYGIAVIGLDSRDFTAQSRRRQFVIGSFEFNRQELAGAFLDAANGYEFSSSSSEEKTPIAACITAHPARVAAEDSYCYEAGRGLRVLTAEECEILQGFPRGWTAGFSRSRRRIMLGKAMTVSVIEWIGKVIIEL